MDGGKRTIGKWAVLLAGPVIWFAHLGFVYAAASLEIAFAFEAGLASRLAVGVATVAGLAATAGIGWAAWRGRIPRWETPQEDLTGLWRKAAGLLCLLSFVAILWQGLPALLVAGAGSHEALYGGTNAPDLDLP